MFNPENQKHLEESFNSFCKRPENERAVSEAQRQEMKQALKLKDQLHWLAFEKLLDQSSAEVQEALAPFLRYKCLRRMIQTFGNGGEQSRQDSLPHGRADEEHGGASWGPPRKVADLASWALNPRVQCLLHQAKHLLESGSMREKELEHLILAQLKGPGGAVAAEFEAVSSPCVSLAPEKLVSALNEHLDERRKGNGSYKAGRPAEAMMSYQRALAIVDWVKGATAADQAEVDKNRVAVLLNMAAASLTLEDYGDAAHSCSRALHLQPSNSLALLRRAKARAMRREFEAAEADLQAVRELHWEEEVADVRRQMRSLQSADRVKDKAFCAKLFS